MRTLVVDHAPAVRELIQAILTTDGQTEVLTSESLDDAFRHLAIVDRESGNAAIDLILMDIMMPDMDGISACRRIKAVERLRDIPIIMVTGRTDSEALQTAFAAGAIDYITKPPDTVELRARVSSALAMKREIDVRKAREGELLEKNRQLAQALKEVKVLRGFLPICVYCKKIRDDQGYWHTLEAYITSHSEADFSHGFCPECLNKHFPA
ncbi:MAG: response regulator [Nitrospirae bacterium]|nr:MAG: response regulator [Nitrospirota bacterium]